MGLVCLFRNFDMVQQVHEPFRLWLSGYDLRIALRIQRLLVWARRHTVSFPHAPIIHEPTDELSFSYASLEILCMSAGRDGLVSRAFPAA